MIRLFLINIMILLGTMQCYTFAKSTNKTNKEKSKIEGGYLFAHMVRGDYGRMYYSISKDAESWKLLNGGKRIVNEYAGHPDIIKGRNDIYYMIGVTPGVSNSLRLWKSADLVDWSIETNIPDAAMFSTPGYKPDGYYSAPKLYFDKDSDQYIILWHASRSHIKDQSDEWWSEMRTFYTLTSDFKTYSAPERLFDFKSEQFKDMATIDVIIRKIGKKYYALVKDERSNEVAPTGKTIMICESKNLTGPYSEPTGITPVSPLGEFHDWVEAPTIVEQPDGKGWYLFVDSYCFQEYFRYDAKDIKSKKWDKKAAVIPNSQHGCMVRLSEEQYKSILNKYDF